MFPFKPLAISLCLIPGRQYDASFPLGGWKAFLLLPQCSVLVNRRNQGKKHAQEIHDVHDGIVIFKGPAAVEVQGEPAPVAYGTRQYGENQVVLNPNINYLKVDAVLNTLGIWFDCGLVIFICHMCGICLTSNMAKGHCKIQHKALISPKAIQELQACHPLRKALHAGLRGVNTP
ncbi:hypothetical protein EV363DRAFT_1295571 [Boletus edulis]|nr:hypothetical protein EV363DRAFT_1295571 [Boletus edulis]